MDLNTFTGTGDRNEFGRTWSAIESDDTRPERARKVITIEFEELKAKVCEGSKSFARELVESVYAGDAYLVKRAFPKEFMERVKKETWAFWKDKPESFHAMHEGVPDFHRSIVGEISAKYYAYPVKRSFYFFPWNGDPLGLFETIWKRWGIFKILGGFGMHEWETNTPKDGMVDRIQVILYPRGAGKIDPHVDPWLSCKPVLSAYMSKRGEDYQTGGAYVVNQKNEIVDLEPNIDVGDMSFLYPTVAHGVRTVDAGQTPDWSKPFGRWWLGPYSVVPNTIQNRHTGHALHIPELSGKV